MKKQADDVLKNAADRTKRLQTVAVSAVVIVLGLLVFGAPMPAQASPFGWGVFGANVPFGSATSLSISLGGDVSLPLSVNGSNFSGTGSNIVTVTSTDVVGYVLYAHTTGSSNLASSSASIPASTNTTDGPLAVGTWGYNTTGDTTNFLGMGTTSSQLKDASGPFTSGDNTTVTYGALT